MAKSKAKLKASEKLPDNELDIHLNPRKYSTLERASAINNMLVRRAGLPESWIIPLPIGEEVKCYDPVLFGITQVDHFRGPAIEGFMLGLAIASGTISLGKCREWLDYAQFPMPHELAMFGMNIRDEFSKEL